MYIKKKQNQYKDNLPEKKSEIIDRTDKNKKNAEDYKTETNVQKSSHVDIKLQDPNTNMSGSDYNKEMTDVGLNGHEKFNGIEESSFSNIKSGLDIFMNDPLVYKPGEYILLQTTLFIGSTPTSWVTSTKIIRGCACPTQKNTAHYT